MDLCLTVNLPSGHSFSASGPAATVLELYAEWKANVADKPQVVDAGAK